MDQAEELRNQIKKNELIKPRSRVITVTSGKGGVGKSNISLNLGISLAKKGNRVIIFDADFGLANIEIMLGVRPSYNLADLMFSGKSLKDIVVEAPYGISFISGGSGIQELSNLSKEQIYYLIHKLNELDELADIIIIDTGAGITDTVLDFLVVSEEVLLVTTPEPTSITDSYSLLKILNRKGEFSQNNTAIKVIANKVGTDKEGLELFNKMSTVAEKFLNVHLKYMGMVPSDEIVSRSVINQKPAIITFPNSAFAKGIRNVSDKLYIDNAKSSENRGIAHLFANLLRKVR